MLHPQLTLQAGSSTGHHPLLLLSQHCTTPSARASPHLLYQASQGSNTAYEAHATQK